MAQAASAVGGPRTSRRAYVSIFALGIADDDFDTAVARLRGHGYDPETVSFDDDDRSRSPYVPDPDGNVVECWTWDVRGDLRSRD